MLFLAQWISDQKSECDDTVSYNSDKHGQVSWHLHCKGLIHISLYTITDCFHWLCCKRLNDEFF